MRIPRDCASTSRQPALRDSQTRNLHRLCKTVMRSGAPHNPREVHPIGLAGGRRVVSIYIGRSFRLRAFCSDQDVVPPRWSTRPPSTQWKKSARSMRPAASLLGEVRPAALCEVCVVCSAARTCSAAHSGATLKSHAVIPQQLSRLLGPSSLEVVFLLASTRVLIHMPFDIAVFVIGSSLSDLE